MNLEQLFKLQNELNEKILACKHLDEGTLHSKKLLALLVELGELANETKSFKYWSIAKPSEKNIVLEEYVDCLHFILTLGLDKHYTHISPNIKPNDYSITEQFLNLYVDINDLMVTSSIDHYTTLFEDFLSLGLSLGFSIEEIQITYIEKNNINHKRQENNY
ncbi:dUTP diphosphatase [Clostridium sp. MSJ-4]|uniref:dUTP diphosphatase n=1 Tax=Clostridium simiarum TaxID=2841506 RepID=A0ABS6F1E5_9CLOT|nr:dUTP diphosphatase [Clostridium simiarum]MBU5592332.1 dUTP diphosphatase [Clostridium simiarum]